MLRIEPTLKSFKNNFHQIEDCLSDTGKVYNNFIASREVYNQLFPTEQQLNKKAVSGNVVCLIGRNRTYFFNQDTQERIAVSCI